MTQSPNEAMDKRYLMLIEALEGTSRDLARLVKPLSADDTHWRPVSGWSVAMLVAHLTYIDRLMLARFHRIVETEHPSEQALEPDETAHVAQAAAYSIAELIEEFRAARVDTCAYLKTLTQPQWLRTCNHSTQGVTRLRKQVENLIGHDNEHLAQIVEIREQLAARAATKSNKESLES